MATGNTIILTAPNPIIIDTVVYMDTLLCAGDSSMILIQAHGGTGDLDYSVDSGSTYQEDSLFMNQPAGAYNIAVVDDNGCIMRDSISVISPLPIVIDSTYIDSTISCYGDSTGIIKVFGSGGTGDLSYNLVDDNGIIATNDSGSFMDIPAGDYAVVLVDDNFCFAISDTFSITQPNEIIINDSVIDPLCSYSTDGEIHLSVSGGTLPYEYSYDGGNNYFNFADTTGLSADTFYISVRDGNGCVATGDTIILASPNPIIMDSIGYMDTLLCAGDTSNILIYASGGTGDLDYSIDSGNVYQNDSLFTGQAAGTYHLAVIDNNACVLRDSISIVAPLPVVIDSVYIDSTIACYGDSSGIIKVFGSGGTGALTYALENNNTVVASNDSGAFTGLGPGIFNVRISDINGCNTLSDTIQIYEPMPLLIDTMNVTGISCHNSADGAISVSASGGTLVYEYHLIESGIYIDTNASGSFINLQPGTYEIEVEDTNGCKSLTTDTTLTNPDSLYITSFDTIVDLCFGTYDIIINATGGTAPIEYSVDGGSNYQLGSSFTVPSGNTYSLAIRDDNNCLGANNLDSTFTLDSLPLFIVDSLITTDVGEAGGCNGDSIGNVIADIIGGGRPLTYRLYRDSSYISVLDGDTLIIRVGDSIVQNGNAFKVQAGQVFSLYDGNMIFTSTDTIMIETGDTVFSNIRLLAYYPFDGNANDISGNNLDGTVNNAVLTKGRYGLDSTAYRFNGTNAYIELPNGADGDPFHDDFIEYTISLWFNADSTNKRQVLYKEGGSSNGANMYIYNDSIWAGVHSQSNGFNGAWINAPVDTGWHHVASVYSKTENYFRLYLDGALKNEIPDNGEIRYHPVDAVIGALNSNSIFESGEINNDSLYFSGIIDDLSIYRYALPATDIADIYNDQPVVAARTAVLGQNDTFDIAEGDTIITVDDTVTNYVPVLVRTQVADSLFTGLPAGDYRFQIEDTSNCLLTSVFDIYEPGEILIDTILKQDISGDTLGRIDTIIARGGSGQLYYYIDTLPIAIDSLFTTTSSFDSLQQDWYYVFVQDSNGCSDMDSILISSLLQIDMDVTHPSCYGDTAGSIALTPLNGTNPYLYSIDGGASFDTINADTTYTFANLASDSVYSLQVVDSSGNKFERMVPITTPSPLIIDTVIVTDVTGCFGDTNGMLNVSVSGGTSPYRYYLNPSKYYYSSNLTNIGAGNQTTLLDTVFVMDTNGCAGYDTFTINQPVPVTVDYLDKTDAIGEIPGSIDSLAVSGGHGNNYRVFIDSNSVDYILNNFDDSLYVPVDSVPSVYDSLNPTVYNIIIKDSIGCIGTETVTIYPGYLDVDISLTHNKCPNENNGRILIKPNGNPFYFFFVTLIDTISKDSVVIDEIIADSIFNPTDTTQLDSIVYDTTYKDTILEKQQLDTIINEIYNQGTTISMGGRPGGAHRIFVRDTSEGLYFDTIVHIYEPDPIEIMATIDSANCENILNGYTDSGAITIDSANGGTPPFAYTWDNSNWPDVRLGTKISNLNAGIYQLSVLDYNDCRYDTNYIVSAPRVTYGLNKDTVNICHGDTFSISVNISDTEYNNFEWFILNDQTDYFSEHNSNEIISYNKKLIFRDDKNYYPPKDSVNKYTTYRQIIYNDDHCGYQDEVDVFLYPIIEFKNNPDVIQLISKSVRPIERVINNDSETTNYLWDVLGNKNADDYLDGVTSQRVDFDPLNLEENDSVIVTLQINNNYCYANDSMIVKMWDGFIPSGFTPNGDGFYDEWIIDVSDDPNINVTVEVYNRWGEKVYMSQNYENDWDGTRNGKELPVGTYYFVITVDDGKETQKFAGPVTIIR
jgi:gliding motility-associated-like protein